MSILIEKLTARGLVRFVSEEQQNARGRVESATLMIEVDGDPIWTGQDTPPAALEWRPILEGALADPPAKKTKKLGKK